MTPSSASPAKPSVSSVAAPTPMRERDARIVPILERPGLTAADPPPKPFLAPLEASAEIAQGRVVVSENPANGRPLGAVRLMTRAEYDAAAERAVEAFKQWRLVPAPVRGEIVRRMGNAFREHKDDLG